MQPLAEYKMHNPNEMIKGLSYVKQLITKQQQIQLIESITKSQWNTTLKRRTQHYGFQYMYDRKNTLSPAAPLPEWSLNVKQTIEELISRQSPLKNHIQFNQLIINQYQPGQGINPHIDNPTLFSSPIVSLSLGSQCIMEFDHVKEEQQSIEVILQRRSIFVLDGDARYVWKHSIPARKKDHGKMRTVRYSLTFRMVKKGQVK